MLSCLLKVKQWHNSKENEIQSFKCLQQMGEVNHLFYCDYKQISFSMPVILDTIPQC